LEEPRWARVKWTISILDLGKEFAVHPFV